jgi:hypothetical protein
MVALAAWWFVAMTESYNLERSPESRALLSRESAGIIASIMVSIPQVRTDAIRRIQRVQTITIVWMSVEAAVSLLAAWRARSPALLAWVYTTVIHGEKTIAGVIEKQQLGIN